MCSQPNHPVAWLTAATPPAMAPYTVVRFGKRQCGPCPEKAECTTGEARTIDFRPRRIHEIQEPTDSDHRLRPPTPAAYGLRWTC